MVDCLRAVDNHPPGLKTEYCANGAQADEMERAMAASAELCNAIECQRAESLERLLKSLEQYGASMRPVAADGNCQFTALSVVLYGHEGKQDVIRAKVFEQLENWWEEYAAFVHEPYFEYIQRMARNGEWGDHVTLQAACDALDIKLKVITDIPEAPSVTVLPRQFAVVAPAEVKPFWWSREHFCITFQSEWHYNAAFFDEVSI